MQLDINQLLVRNPQIIKDNTLIVYPPVDRTLAKELKSGNCALQSNDSRNHDFYQQQGLTSYFGLPEDFNTTNKPGNILLYWPKSKPFALSTLHWLASQIDAPTDIWVLAANDAGGKSLNKPLSTVADQVSKVDMARKCSLWFGKLLPTDKYQWQQDMLSFTYEDLNLATYPGVFNSGKLDVGTRLLLENLTLPKSGKLLDLGCGSGVIGLTCKARQPDLDVSLCDIDAMALASSQYNSEQLNLAVTIFPSDGLAAAEKYQLIISNPPFHQGKNTDYQFAETLFSEAAKHLLPGGELWIVANRHLAYEQWAGQHCRQTEVIVQAQGFKVLRCTY